MRLAAMYIRFSLSLRNVKDLLHERGVDVCFDIQMGTGGSYPGKIMSAGQSAICRRGAMCISGRTASTSAPGWTRIASVCW